MTELLLYFMIFALGLGMGVFVERRKHVDRELAELIRIHRLD